MFFAFETDDLGTLGTLNSESATKFKAYFKSLFGAMSTIFFISIWISSAVVPFSRRNAENPLISLKLYLGDCLM